MAWGQAASVSQAQKPPPPPAPPPPPPLQGARTRGQGLAVHLGQQLPGVRAVQAQVAVQPNRRHHRRLGVHGDGPHRACSDAQQVVGGEVFSGEDSGRVSS